MLALAAAGYWTSRGWRAILKFRTVPEELMFPALRDSE
jgi:hypothetical protein